MRLIQDKFTSLKVSRQRRYQLRREAAGLCRLCGDKATPESAYCKKHLAAQRRHVRRNNSARAEDLI